MLLTIDVGNTNITFGIFHNGRIIKRFDIPTKVCAFKKLKNKLGDVNINDAIICSVVPKVSRVLSRDLKRLLRKPPYILGKNITAPIKNLYRRPKEVGQDRLVNAYAGVKFYNAPLIVVDFGTAVTFDVISKNEDYLGGMILPGLGISLAALAEHAALLPKIEVARPKEFIGRDTRSSMLSGVVYGLAALVDDLVVRIKAKIGIKAKVIATGGNSGLVSRYCRKIDKVDRDITLKGLELIYQRILQKNS